MRKSKRIVGAIVMILTVAAMLCVWPICLARRSTEVATMVGAQYCKTEETLRQGGTLEQTFVAQESVLYGISFAVGFDVPLPEEGKLLFSLEEAESGEILKSCEISFEELEDCCYYYVKVGRYIKKGAEYKYILTVPDVRTGIIRGLYTIEPGQEPAGSQLFVCNGKNIAGQAVTAYDYGFPLNIKNIVCIWAFILVIGLTLLQKCGVKLPVGEKAEAFIRRFRVPLFATAILGTTILIVRICLNEAVDWDEAFTWQLITKNNLAGIIKGTAEDVHPPLYYLVAKAAITLFGQHIFVVKMVSVTLSVGSMLLCAIFVSRRFGEKAALLLIPIVGLGPRFIYYNVNCRMYSMMIFFVLGAALFAYELIQDDKPIYWVLFTVFSLGGVYTQYFAVVPLVLIYLYLLVQLLKDKGTSWMKWLLCCTVTIVGYLPWLGVVMRMLKNERNGVIGERSAFQLQKFFREIFETNIEYSAYMPFVLFLLCVLVLVLEWNRYGKKERAFLLMSGSILWIVEWLCLSIAGNMSHFWTERYIVDAIIFVWLFVAVVVSKQGIIIWGTACVWTAVMVLSSYTIVKASELNTVPWTTDAKTVLSEAQDEEIILYNFPTYDVIYSYYLPNAEFIWLNDVDFSQILQDYVYMMRWGGQEFDDVLSEQWDISIEIVGTVRLEQGMAGIELVKVHFK